MSIRTEELMLNMGPQHPSTHGVLRLLVTLDGENVVGVDPDIGYLHSSVEKMFEHRTYFQNISLADRGMDYLSWSFNEMALLQAVEKLGAIEVPERGWYLRTIMMEMTRIASHLLWLGTWGIDLGAVTLFLWNVREREMIYDLWEAVSGGRLHNAYFRIGGVGADTPPGWEDRAYEFTEYFLDRLPEYHQLLTANPIFEVRTQGVGVLRREDAIAFGASGPVARAAGVDWDVRRDQPYGIYDRFTFSVPVQQAGDCFSRYLVRMEEMRQSTLIIQQALKAMPAGEIRSKVQVALKLPKGEAYGRVESPRGDEGVFLVSDGGERPYRAKIRGPSFSNLFALTEMMKGWKIADVIAILGSVDIVLADVDR